MSWWWTGRKPAVAAAPEMGEVVFSVTGPALVPIHVVDEWDGRTQTFFGPGDHVFTATVGHVVRVDPGEQEGWNTPAQETRTVTLATQVVNLTYTVAHPTLTLNLSGPAGATWTLTDEWDGGVWTYEPGTHSLQRPLDHVLRLEAGAVVGHGTPATATHKMVLGSNTLTSAYAEAASEAMWLWNGAPESDAMTVSVRLAQGEQVALEYGTDPSFAIASTTAPVAVHPESHVARVRLTGLTPGTVYHYRAAGLAGRFRTAVQGAQGFTFASSSCANGNNNTVFERIRVRAPDVFIHLGDMHYWDVPNPLPGEHWDAIDANLGHANQQKLWSQLGTAHVWSDHDFAGEDSNRTSPGKPGAVAAFRAAAPYAYAQPEAIGQTWVIGRVQFILTDTRSQADPVPMTPAEMANPSLTRMGAAQKQWFKDTCLAAKAAGRVIVWGSAETWTGTDREGDDQWRAYPAERRELADFFQEHDLNRSLMIVAGDAHMLGYQDGHLTNFATAPNGQGPKVFQTAALNNNGSLKGSPYTVSYVDPNFRGQYGFYTVRDLGGGTITIQGDLFTSDAAHTGSDVQWAGLPNTLAVPGAAGVRTLTVNVTGPPGAFTSVVGPNGTLEVLAGAETWQIPVQEGSAVYLAGWAPAPWEPPAVAPQVTVGATDPTLNLAYVNTAAPPNTLVTDGLYGSWRFTEGSGTTAGSEGALVRPLTLGNDAGNPATFPTWRAGGGLNFNGNEGWLRRLNNNAEMDVSGGITITLAGVRGNTTNTRPMVQRSAGNNGYALNFQTSSGRFLTSTGDGAARVTRNLPLVGVGEAFTLCVTLPQDAVTAMGINHNGVETVPSNGTTTNAWVNAQGSNLLMAYGFVGQLHYAAVHHRVLSEQERAQMVAYAQAIMQARS